MKTTIKKTLLGSCLVILVLAIALGVHVYIVTQHKTDNSTQALARIDFKQDITDDDAAKIYAWLDEHEGIDRIILNTATNNAVFTFSPLKINADKIAAELHSYKAVRYKPSPDDMRKGCPVSEQSASYRFYRFFKNIF